MTEEPINIDLRPFLVTSGSHSQASHCIHWSKGPRSLLYLEPSFPSSHCRLVEHDHSTSLPTHSQAQKDEVHCSTSIMAPFSTQQDELVVGVDFGTTTTVVSFGYAAAVSAVSTDLHVEAN